MFTMQVDNSISARFGVGGYGLGIRVDMDVFKQGLTSEMKFGRKTHTYTSGSDDMHGMSSFFFSCSVSSFVPIQATPCNHTNMLEYIKKMAYNITSRNI